MTIILVDARSRTSYHETRSRLGRLLRLTIQTGSLTAFLAIVIVALFSVEDKIGLLQTVSGYMLGKSYVLSLLANLNVRTGQVSVFKRRIQAQASLQFERNKNFSKNGSRGQGLSFISTRDIGFSFNPADSSFPAEFVESDNSETAKGVPSTHEVAIRSQADIQSPDGGFMDPDTFQLKQLDSKMHSTAELSGNTGGLV